MRGLWIKRFWALAVLVVACRASPSARPAEPAQGANPPSETTGKASELAEPATSQSKPVEPTLPECAAVAEAAALLPGVAPEQLELDHWLEHWSKQFDLDEVLLSRRKVERLNASIQVSRKGYYPQRDLLKTLDRAELVREVNDRRVWATKKLTAADYVDVRGEPIETERLAVLQAEVPLSSPKTSLRVVLRDTQIHCAPLPFSFYSSSLDLRLDRNACSTLRSQELVRVVASWPNGMQLVQGAYSFGWLAADAELSEPVPRRLRQAYAHGPWLQVHGRSADQPLSVRQGKAQILIGSGTFVPALSAQSKRAHVAGAAGFATTTKRQARALRRASRGLTRRALFSEAWRYMGTPYGLGGTNAGRDCSRLLLDVFASVGVKLPRHSTWQAEAASFTIDTTGADEAARLVLLDEAAKRGIVLLYFPGHIMLYLGRDEQGVPRVLHAFGEYLEACEGNTPERPRETLLRVKNITVSGLELGRDTTRTSFLKRITRIAVFGKPPGPKLRGVADVRPPAPLVMKRNARCRDSRRSAIYALPERPNIDQPLRVVAAMDRDPGATGLTLIDPDGRRIVPKAVRLGGPPYGQVVTVENPKRGRWQAVFADGDQVSACQNIQVFKKRPKFAEPSEGPVWKPKWGWSVSSENLYALFVERLFDYPAEDDQVWPNLHTLLRDPERNLLYDYRGWKEEEELELQPDCADLPYTLRAYFAWKMRMPFGFRRCTRARNGRPPNCNQEEVSVNFFSSLMDRLELKTKEGQNLLHDDVEAFELFVNRHMRYTVHSSSGRTLPEDDMTDFYPVPLTRRALKPGTLFADPYGHLLVVADWRPQAADSYGVLVGVDAQPDGTIGRRRFWRGSFLFDSETDSGGAGFKAFRPRKFVKEPVTVNIKSGEPVLVPTDGADAGVGEFAELESPQPQPVEVESERPPATVERLGFLEDLTNEELAKTGRFTRFSDQQYRGSKDDFYTRVQSLINERPLDPEAVQRSLVDALAESVARRITSVNNGEGWVAEHPEQTMEMPQGARIFLSAGPWEDFSTPSRDLRLLISIDSVTGFVDRVRRAPGQFGIEPEDLKARLRAVEESLSAALKEHTFEYRSSGGVRFRLSLQDLVDRSERFEMAYNPNDCIELRWGALLDSEEGAQCERQAPEEQRQRMRAHRNWFATRTRPAR